MTVNFKTASRIQTCTNPTQGTLVVLHLLLRQSSSLYPPPSMAPTKRTSQAATTILEQLVQVHVPSTQQ